MAVSSVGVYCEKSCASKLSGVYQNIFENAFCFSFSPNFVKSEVSLLQSTSCVHIAKPSKLLSGRTDFGRKKI